MYRSDSSSLMEDGVAMRHREAYMELRERQILDQYYETSRVLKNHLRGGSYIAQATAMSPISTRIKVKTL